MPKEQVDSALAPTARQNPMSLADEVMAELAKERSAPFVTVSRGDIQVSLRR
jgi:hypothetical protein